MYKEKVKPVGKTIFFVIGIVAATMILMGLLDMAVIFFNLPYPSIFQLTILALLSIGVYILIRNILCEYEYAIVDDELIITSSLGDNEKLISRLYLSQIKLVTLHSDAKAKHIHADGRYVAKKSLFSPNVYICFFEAENKTYKLYFEPSGKLLEILKKRGVNVK